jgi:HEAT repeat protein
LDPAYIERLAESRDVDGLVAALEDPEPRVRVVAAQALGLIGDERAVKALGRRLQDPHKRDTSYEADRTYHVEIAYPVRDAAKEALETMGGARAEAVLHHYLIEVPALMDRVQQAKSAREFAFLVEALEYPGVREEAEKALTELADPVVIESLLPVLDSEDADVGDAAARILMSLGDGRGSARVLVVAARKEEWTQRDKASRAVKRAGSDAVPALIAALSDENVAVRWSAAELLGDIGDESASEPLRALLRDEDEGVREMAAQSLQAISRDE